MIPAAGLSFLARLLDKHMAYLRANYEKQVALGKDAQRFRRGRTAVYFRHGVA